jgi:hypothetical protein
MQTKAGPMGVRYLILKIGGANITSKASGAITHHLGARKNAITASPTKARYADTNTTKLR